MSSIFQITASGRVGQEPKLGTIPSGKQVLNFSLAVDTWNGKEKGTTWLDCAMWGERGAKVAEYLDKGTPITIQGEPSVRTYEAKDGSTKATLSVSVYQLALQGKGGGSQRSDDAPSGGGQQSKDFDDDIPF
jgi:single-strand DNA-binding protein